MTVRQLSGVAGLQSQAGLEPSGWLDEETFEVLRISLVPTAKGIAHGGEPLFDSVCLTLLRSRREAVRASLPAGEDQIRAAIAEFLEKAEANEPRWHYSQNRPVTVDVDPSAASIKSDCSGIVDPGLPLRDEEDGAGRRPTRPSSGSRGSATPTCSKTTIRK